MQFKDHKQTAKEYKIGGGDFWKPEDGDNKIRILTGYEVYGFHWDNKIRKGGVCIGKDKGCEWCAKENKASVKFLMWVIDRKDGEVKLMQIGYTVIQQLGDLQENQDWKFDGVPDYDIVVKKTGKDLETKYFVTPTPTRSNLTADEQEAVIGLKDIKDIIGKMKEKAGGSPSVIQEENNDELKPEEAPELGFEENQVQPF